MAALGCRVILVMGRLSGLPYQLSHPQEREVCRREKPIKACLIGFFSRVVQSCADYVSASWSVSTTSGSFGGSMAKVRSSAIGAGCYPLVTHHLAHKTLIFPKG